LREEHRLRVFENSVSRRIFGPKREGDGPWRKLHNDELHSLYSSPNIVRVIKSRRLRWAGHVASMGEGRGVYRVMSGKFLTLLESVDLVAEPLARNSSLICMNVKFSLCLTKYHAMKTNLFLN
jgi:hypothetical protein